MVSSGPRSRLMLSSGMRRTNVKHIMVVAREAVHVSVTLRGDEPDIVVGGDLTQSSSPPPSMEQQTATSPMSAR
jgi:hypothetical protein